MDWLPTQETLSICLLQYGSIMLFILLALGIIALPVPEETLMVFAGVLMSKGHLHISTTLIAAYLGSICGITISYIIGKKIGLYFITSYGKVVGLKEHHLQKVDIWFKKFGKWALFIGYFIPGVRHFTGFSAGITSLEIRTFVLYAYTGAIFWVSTFLALGYFSSEYWVRWFGNIEIDIDAILVLIILLSMALFLGFLKHSTKTR